MSCASSDKNACRRLFARRRGLARSLAALAAAAVCLAAVGVATGAMRTTKLKPNLCETTGGGKFVKMPGFPGEKIDRRLKNDIRFLRKRFKIHVTDGYSLDPVHSANGEHPIGLALDIVPDFKNGGNWKKITRLAKWAEPKQNQPRMPFRWVGYNGDAGHGRGHHLHLSYAHSKTSFNKPARTVYSIKCPGKKAKPDPKPDGGGKNGGSGGGKGGSNTGGTSSTGGISLRGNDLERVRRETGGIGLR